MRLASALNLNGNVGFKNMNEKPPYRKWVGGLLGILLNGSAHFLSGRRATGLKWYFGLFACGILATALLATPGTASYILGLAAGLGGLVLWFVMLKQSCRPVRRIGLLGWLAVLVLAVALGSSQKILLRQFIHPFKVPTGAMQPTVCGIHGQDLPVDSDDKPGMLQWFLSGSRYHEVRATTDGALSLPAPDPDEPAQWTYRIGGQSYQLPRFARPLKQPGEHVSAGETLWAGIISAGDHLFVERVSYRFVKPKRGDIVVFRTDGIETLPPRAYYVKRIAGLPGERIRISPPLLIVNDQKVTEPAIFRRIADGSDGYAGFQLTVGAGHLSGRLAKSSDQVTLGPEEYFVLGDNTRNSRDSRYWGAVPRRNIIGKVTRIYWPFTRINALEEK